jgi:hypothetical protein
MPQCMSPAARSAVLAVHGWRSLAHAGARMATFWSARWGMLRPWRAGTCSRPACDKKPACAQLSLRFTEEQKAELLRARRIYFMRVSPLLQERSIIQGRLHVRLPCPPPAI